MIYLILILIIIIAIYIFLKLRGKKEKITNETTIAYVGGLGSGKTLNGVKRAIKLYKQQVKKWKIEKNGQPAPMLISNIPLRRKMLGKTYNSVMLTKDILLMKKQIPQGSIIFIDEIGTIANQYDWNLEEVKDNLTEFIRLYRQYVNGFIVITDQTLAGIVKPIRDRINAVVYCLITNKVSKFYCTQLCILRFTQQIDSYTADSLNALRQRKYGIFTNNYDTRAYSERYTENVEKIQNIEQQDTLKTNKIIKIKNTSSKKNASVDK